MARSEDEIFDVNKAYEAYLCNPCEMGLEAVIEQGEFLVRHFALVYGCGCNFDDLYQSGMLGIVKATKSYDGRALFSTWASWCIISEIRHFVRSERDFIETSAEKLAEKETASAAAGVYHIAFRENETSKSLHDYQSFHLALEDRIMLEQAFKKLSALQKKVIDALFYRGLTQQQTATELGLNQRKVSRLKQNALVSLSAMMAEPYVKVG